MTDVNVNIPKSLSFFRQTTVVGLPDKLLASNDADMNTQNASVLQNTTAQSKKEAFLCPMSMTSFA